MLASKCERPIKMIDQHHDRNVRKILLEQRDERDTNWPGLSELNGQRCDKKSANKFMLGAILDFQITANQAWENARRFAEEELGDPDDLWETIVSSSRSDWRSHFNAYRLHRFGWAHDRVWRIGKEIVDRYDGDARKIWTDQNAEEILCRLLDMRVGPQISRMVVGALWDTGQIDDFGELKADLHVRRVLGRVFKGSKVSAHGAHEIANRIAGGPTWHLDEPLYTIGQRFCKPMPLCRSCPLDHDCLKSTKI